MKRLDAYSVKFVMLVFVFILLVSICTVNTCKKIIEKEIKNSFRNIYTIYSENLQSTVIDMAGDIGCYYSPTEGADLSKCDEFYSTFVQNMKVRKYCKDNAVEEKCVPEYKSYSNLPECYGFTKEMIEKQDDVFVMDNGSNIIIFNTRDGKRAPIFAVDVNGFKKPNKAGEDLFTMLIVKNANNSYFFHSNITYCLPVEKGGIEYIQDIYK